MAPLIDTQCFEAHYPAELESVTASRRMVVDALKSWGIEDPVTADAALTVSELVTNCILHAGTPLSVAIRQLGRGVRIEVRDTNDVLPIVGVSKPEDLLANRSMTGRGLALVAGSSDRWGADPLPGGGKVIWAELGTGRRLVASAPPPAFPPAAAPPQLLPRDVAAGVTTTAAMTAGGRKLHLKGVPVRLLIESNRQLADLHRELQVIAMDNGAPEELEQLLLRTREIAADLDRWTDSDRLLAEAAMAGGQERLDFDVLVSPDIETGLDRFAGWLRKLTSSLVRRHLLTLPPSEEVAAYRDWYREEILAQLSGASPRPCPLEP